MSFAAALPPPLPAVLPLRVEATIWRDRAARPGSTAEQPAVVGALVLAELVLAQLPHDDREEGRRGRDRVG